jgi:Family of unknown function (DUF6931)
MERLLTPKPYSLTKLQMKFFEDGLDAVEADYDLGKLLWQSESCADVVELLLEKGRSLDAMRFMMITLPVADAIRWGYEICQILNAQLGDLSLTPELQKIKQWLDEPTSKHRQQVADGWNNILETPTAWLKQAVIWTGGFHETNVAIKPSALMIAHTCVNVLVLACECLGDDIKTKMLLLRQGLSIASNQRSELDKEPSPYETAA